MAKFEPHATYTDAELLALWRAADAQVAATGVSYAIAGRTLTRADAEMITEKIQFYEQRVNAADSSRRAVNYIRFRRPCSARDDE